VRKQKGALKQSAKHGTSSVNLNAKGIKGLRPRADTGMSTRERPQGLDASAPAKLGDEVDTDNWGVGGESITLRRQKEQ
jgi:hypothetical protein